MSDLLSNIRTEHSATVKTHAEQQEAFEKLYEQLNTKILSLLPGAGAAGLSSSYYSAKLRYSPTNDIMTDGEAIQKQSISRRKFLSQFVSLAFNYALFIVPLIMIYEAFEGKTLAKDFGDSVVEALIYKVTVTLPMLGLSGFGLASILTNRRLYEEYNHKQRVMELYHSFKDEIEITKDEGLRIKLLHLMLDVVQDKPAKRLDRHERNAEKFYSSARTIISSVEQEKATTSK